MKNLINKFSSLANELTATILTCCNKKVKLSDFYAYAESLTSEVVNSAHNEAFEMLLFEKLSNRERNVIKRNSTETSAKRKSVFASCTDCTKQSYQIDEAMTEFRNALQILKVANDNLDDDKRIKSIARIISHKRYLLANYKNTCKIEYEKEYAVNCSEEKKSFRFIKL